MGDYSKLIDGRIFMGVAILFRKRQDKVPFIHFLNKIAQLQGEQFVLCSAYFAEQSNISQVIDDFSNALKSGNNQELYFIGGMFQDRKDSEGSNNKSRFLSLFRAFRSKGILVKAARFSHESGHAKMAFKVRDGKPIAAIIGSSNFTKSATTVSATYWNHECEILIWNETLTDTTIMQDHGYNGIEVMELNLKSSQEDVILNEFYDSCYC
jgi:hypothetical protein